MNKPLSVTSTTNFHAIGNYTTLTLLGLFYTLTPRAQALDDMLTPRLAGVMMALMILFGAGALVLAVTAAKRKDPTPLLWAEAIILWCLATVLICLLIAVILKWGIIVAMTSSVLLFGILFGSIGRSFQAWGEYRRLMRARRAPRSTTVVAAEPDLE